MSLFLSIALSLPVTSVLAPPQTSAPAVGWLDGSLDVALARASVEQRPLVVCFTGGESARVLDLALASPAAAERLTNALVLRLSDETRSAALLEQHHLGAETAVIQLSPRGELVDALGTLATPDELVLELERSLAGRDTLRALEERSRATRPDSAAGLELASLRLERLEAVGEQERAGELRKQLCAADPKGTTRAGAMLQLRAAEERVLAADTSTDEMSMSMPDLTPIEGVAKKSRFPEVRGAAWSWLSLRKRAEGDRTAALDAAHAAWEATPAARRDRLGPELLEAWLAEGAALDSGQRKRLLALAEAVLESAEKLGHDADVWRASHPVTSAGSFQAECQRLLAKALLLDGKEKQATAALARAAELAGVAR